jgi:hypothetical protein
LRSQLRVDFILHHGVIINHNLCADICHHGTPGVRPDSHRNTSYLLIKMPKRLWSVFALLIAKHQAKLQVEASTVFKHLDEDNKPTHNVFPDAPLLPPNVNRYLSISRGWQPMCVCTTQLRSWIESWTHGTVASDQSTPTTTSCC